MNEPTIAEVLEENRFLKERLGRIADDCPWCEIVRGEFASAQKLIADLRAEIAALRAHLNLHTTLDEAQP